MSETVRKTLRNTTLLIAFEVANPLLSLILVGTMTRKLGPEGFGAYSLLLNYFFVLHSFTSLGLNALITREVARDKDGAGRYLGSAALLGLAVTLAGAVSLMAVVRWAGYGPEMERAAWPVALALIPSIVILYSESIFIAFEKIQYIVYLAMLENTLKVGIGLWLLKEGFGVHALILSFTALRYLNLVLNLWIFHRRIHRLPWRFDGAVVSTLARGIPVFGTILIVATLYARADVFLLSKMATLAAVGYYMAAYRLFSITQVVPKSFNTSIYPVLSSLFSRSLDDYRKAKSLSIRYILVVLLPIAAGIYGLADPLVRLLFGQDFNAAAPVLRVVIWTLVPYGVTKVLASSLFASDRQVIDLKVNILGLATNVGLNLFLIPRYGALGCAWATLLSICVFLGCQFLFLRGEILSILARAEVFRPALAAGAILAWLSLTEFLPLPVRVAGGAVIYVLLLFLLQVIKISEFRMVLPRRFLAGLPEEREP